MRITLGALAELVGGYVVGDSSVIVEGLTTPERAGRSDLVFATDERWLELASASQAAAVLIPEGMECSKPALAVADVRQAVQRVLHLFEREFSPAEGISPLAYVSPSARLGEGCAVGPFACILDNAILDRRVKVHPFAFVGEECTIGEGTVLFPRATLMPRTVVGKNCRLHAGCVIGEAGFGYREADGRHEAIPQVGYVEIGDDCDIGANVTIDRAMVGATVIGKGTKIDNLVQVGHNVRIGANCILVAQTGLSGSARIHDNVVLGGQTGVVEHVEIVSGVRTGGQTGVNASLTEPGDYWGTPARPFKQIARIIASSAKLPELVKEVRALRKRVEELERKGDKTPDAGQ